VDLGPFDYGCGSLCFSGFDFVIEFLPAGVKIISLISRQMPGFAFGLTVDGNKRTALATCLVFLSENELLPPEELDVEGWEALTLDVAGSRIDREETTQRLGRLLKVRKRKCS
jgi:hypothetical protein